MQNWIGGSYLNLEGADIDSSYGWVNDYSLKHEIAPSKPDFVRNGSKLAHNHLSTFPTSYLILNPLIFFFKKSVHDSTYQIYI